MASPEQWNAARKTWCEDSRTGFGWLSESLGVSRQAVSKMAAKQGWEKVAQPNKVKPIQIQPIRVVAQGRSVSCSKFIKDDVDAGIGFIYVVEMDISGVKHQKIGRAKNVYNRLRIHQTSSPVDLKVLLAYLTPNMIEEEKAVHAMFVDKFIRGEWFQLDPEDIALIAVRSYNRG